MLGALALIRLAGAVVVLLAGFGSGLYAADYEVGATIVDKACAGPAPPDPDTTPEPPRSPDEAAAALAGGANSTVTVRPRVLGVPFTVDVEAFPDDRCWPLRAGDDGNYVTYRVRTATAVFYEREGGVCIFHTVFGPGCVLADALRAAFGNRTMVQFALSTLGYGAGPLGSSSAANCAVFPASGVRHIAANATWVAGATDETLRLVLEALDDQDEPLAMVSATGASVLAAELDVPADASTFTVAIFPDDEAIGTTSSIDIELVASGVDDLPSASPGPCAEPGAYVPTPLPVPLALT